MRRSIAACCCSPGRLDRHGILFGLLPALHSSRSALVQALREGTRGAGTRSRTRQAARVAEVAMALVLLVSAGLLARSFHGLQRIDVGFNPANLLTMRADARRREVTYEPAPRPGLRDRDPARFNAAGVHSAAAVLALPVRGGGFYPGRRFIRPGLIIRQRATTRTSG